MNRYLDKETLDSVERDADMNEVDRAQIDLPGIAPSDPRCNLH